MAVYFANAGPYVKIGYSVDPFSRVANVTTGCKRPEDLPFGADVKLLGWVPGGLFEESFWHGKFVSDRVAGEWFYLSPDVVRESIWADPRGVDVQRMSAFAVLFALAHPEMTRAEIGSLGVPVEAAPLEETLERMDLMLGGAA